MKDNLWITGIVPAVFTPMHEDGTINLPMIEQLTAQLIRDGIGALYVCGSTGEGPSLSIEERMAVAEAYVKAVTGRLPVIVQVGHDSLRQARKLAEHAQVIGAAAISAVPPTYYEIPTLDLLIDCLAEIIAGAPELPFYYYHIPRLTAVDIDVEAFLLQGGERLPSLRGVKYSNTAVYELQACIDLDGGRYNILFGSDEMLLSGLVGGAHGCVGSTYNFAAPLYSRVIKAFQRGDIPEAQRLQGLAVKMVQCLNRFGSHYDNACSIKATMKLIGLDCGPLRLPQASLTSERLELLRAALEEIGFFRWARSHEEKESE